MIRGHRSQDADSRFAPRTLTGTSTDAEPFRTVRVAAPGAIAVTAPDAETVATVAFEVTISVPPIPVTRRTMPSANLPYASSWAVASPAIRVRAAGRLSSEMIAPD